MFELIRRLLPLAMALVLTACESGQTIGPAAHAWLNSPVTDDPKSVQLPGWLIYRVPAARLDEAVAELESEPYIQISPSMAQHYSQAEIRVPAEMRPFLVRAVEREGCSFEAVQSMQGLWLRCVGGSGDATSQPLVVLLDPTPRDIFVSLETTPATD